MNAQAVTFRNRNGRNLFGIYHPAASGQRNLCIVLLSPGIKNRVAPHRLYVKLARRLSEMGYDVFRFDPEGLGDSEGECRFEWVADLYGAIQSGCFQEDTLAALDWLEANKATDKFIVGGLCGGAITGMFAGRKDPRVAGLLSIGIPVVLESSDPNQERFVSAGQKDKLRRGYLARLLQPRSWLRLLTFRSDFRMLYRSIFRRGSKVAGSPPGERPVSDGSARGGADPFNPAFPDAFDAFLGGRREMLLVFSGADRISWEFEELFAGPYESLLRKHEARIERHVIDGANHIMSFQDWQDDMLRIVDQWLGERFSG